jgi:phage terminase large subunit-like protein
MNVVDAYAQAVVLGAVPAGRYHRLSCVRHLKDVTRPVSAEFPYRFELAQAEKFFRFAEKLKHYKGEWAGQSIRLSDFQKFRLGCIFGWRHVVTGNRRFTTAYNELTRKTGKSLEAAVVAIFVTFFEGEPGAEGYCLATKEKQATDVVFRDIKRLIQSSGLKGRLRVQVKNVHQDATMSKLEPLGSDSETLDGLNPHLLVTDELHAWKSRGLLDVMESATGARRNPLNYEITTAGSDPVSVCGDQHNYACQILDGVFEDFASESFFACIAHADPEDDWLSEDTWKKANPHYGISVNPDDMRKLALKAKAMPSAAAEFKQKRLNLWVNADQPWLSLEGWRAGQSSWDPRDLRDERCWAAVDLSSVLDLTAVVLVFPPTALRLAWRYLPWILTPADTLAKRAHRDRAPYLIWADDNHLTTNPGPRIDQDVVLAHLKAMKALYAIQEVGIDPWNAGNLSQHLIAEGFSVIEVPQNFARMSKPSKDFEADVVAGLVDTGNHPVMTWMASNAVVQKDGKDNIQPIKKRSRGRIDGIVAAIIGRGLASVQKPAPPPSIYANPGTRLWY